MFLIYIDELVDILDSFGIKAKVFADDFKLYIRIINEVGVTTLQEALNFLANVLYAIARSSVCLSSVCLSVCLSVVCRL